MIVIISSFLVYLYKICFFIFSKSRFLTMLTTIIFVFVCINYTMYYLEIIVKIKARLKIMVYFCKCYFNFYLFRSMFYFYFTILFWNVITHTVANNKPHSIRYFKRCNWVVTILETCLWSLLFYNGNYDHSFHASLPPCLSVHCCYGSNNNSKQSREQRPKRILLLLQTFRSVES